jgi:hypothetical protein
MPTFLGPEARRAATSRPPRHNDQVGLMMLVPTSAQTSTPSRERRRDGARRDPVADYPEAARACAPRDHVDLSPRYRHTRDRRHGPPPPATGDPGERRPAAITRTRGARGRRIARPFLIAGLRSATAPRASGTGVVRQQARMQATTGPRSWPLRTSSERVERPSWDCSFWAIPAAGGGADRARSGRSQSRKGIRATSSPRTPPCVWHRGRPAADARRTKPDVPLRGITAALARLVRTTRGYLA